MSARNYGAGAQVWKRLADTYLLPDLLPVVSNPEASISPQSRMQALGKTPSWYNSEGNASGIGQWTARITDREEVERWAKEPDYGVCIQTRQLRAIDVDVDNPVASSIIQDAILEFMGKEIDEALHLPVRMRSNSGKLLIPFRYDGELFKRRFTCHMGGLVEMLATGQQFVAYGTHPSGVKYEWQNIPENAPTLSIEEVDELWHLLVTRFAVPDSEKRGRRSTDGSGVHRPDIADPVYQYLERTGSVIDFDDRKGHAHIVCPFEDEHSTHTLTSTTYMLAGSHGHDSGHFSCLHASCAGRVDGDFLNACGYTAAGFDDEVVAVLGETADFTEQQWQNLKRLSDVRGASVTHPSSAQLKQDIEDAALLGVTPSIDELLPPEEPVGRRVAEGYDAVEPEWPTFFRNKNGEIDATIDNVVRALECPAMCGAALAYDEFLCKIVVNRGDGPRMLTDIDAIDLRIALERRGFKSIGVELARDAIRKVADANRCNSAQRWLEGLVWDGVPRMDTFIAKCFKVKDDPAYTAAVGNYLMTALAARVMYPGCKVDMVPVLTSSQGTVKTSSIEALSPSPDMFGEMDLGMKDDDIARLLTGKCVVELAELKGLKNREVEHLRSLITRRVEEWVPKYQENPVRRARTCVFIATTNEHNMLVDTQGNRRWLPLVVSGQVDITKLRRVRDQLWAEGAQRVRERVEEGFDPVEWEVAHALGKAKQAEHEVHDPLVEALDEWLERPVQDLENDQDVKNCELPFTILKVIDSLPQSVTRGLAPKALANRVGELLRARGYVRKVVRSPDGTVAKRWMRSAESLL